MNHGDECGMSWLPGVTLFVNRNFTEQKSEIATLHAEVKELNKAALAKAESEPPAGEPLPVIIVDTETVVPVAVQKEV